MVSLKNSVVCITGASSGIGSACAREFAQCEADLLLVARRKERVETLAEELHAKHGIATHKLCLDVRNKNDVQDAFATLSPQWQHINILVNNAGLSRGLDKIYEGRTEDWDEMIDTNIKGLLYVTREILPGMVARKSGHVINIGSIAGHQTYPSGNVYSATKFALTGITRSMIMDLLGTNVRVTTVDPGLVATEFSEVRFRGDRKRAAQVYVGFTPLRAEDIADAVVYCATRPPHMNIQELVVTPTDQATVSMVHRKT